MTLLLWAADSHDAPSFVTLDGLLLLLKQFDCGGVLGSGKLLDFGAEELLRGLLSLRQDV